MAERFHVDGEHGDLEAQIRAAGRYVRASDDLRPAVLEAARADRLVQHSAMTLAGLAAAAVVATWLVTAVAERAESHRQSADTVAEADVWQLDATARNEAMLAMGGPSWGLVDVFGGVRDRQAELLSAGNADNGAAEAEADADRP